MLRIAICDDDSSAVAAHKRMIAAKIKPHLPNVKIIFITSHIEYAIDAFELSIFRYVPKNDIMKRLPAAIQDAVKLSVSLPISRAHLQEVKAKINHYWGTLI